MNQIFRIETISQLNDVLKLEKPRHPLITIADLSKVNEDDYSNMKLMAGFYSIFLKNINCGKLKYGRQNYDFQEGTLVFIAPEQVLEVEPNTENTDSTINSWGLFFHPDLIKGTSLGTKIKLYTFFSYDSNEALHLSDKEREIINDIVHKIDYELSQNIDKHSQNLIVSSLDLLLNYCLRFYDRQFITRSLGNRDILSRFESFLSEYCQSESLKENGLPTVKLCAEKLNLSPNYLSDLLKKETGKNTQEHIHYYLIEEAKNKLLISNDRINEIAYELGFEYPQYFSRIFKRHTGQTPAEYRDLN